MSRVLIDLDTRCGVCDRRVGVVQPWVPFGRGIRHASCKPECRGCGDAIRPGDEVLNETGDAFCGDCAEALTIEVEPDLGDE